MPHTLPCTTKMPHLETHLNCKNAYCNKHSPVSETSISSTLLHLTMQYLSVQPATLTSSSTSITYRNQPLWSPSRSSSSSLSSVSHKARAEISTVQAWSPIYELWSLEYQARPFRRRCSTTQRPRPHLDCRAVLRCVYGRSVHRHSRTPHHPL